MGFECTYTAERKVTFWKGKIVFFVRPLFCNLIRITVFFMTLHGFLSIFENGCAVESGEAITQQIGLLPEINTIK